MIPPLVTYHKMHSLKGFFSPLAAPKLALLWSPPDGKTSTPPLSRQKSADSPVPIVGAVGILGLGNAYPDLRK
jgi:hypothetical protein